MEIEKWIVNYFFENGEILVCFLFFFLLLVVNFCEFSNSFIGF